jgi:hypothetical protein
MKKIFILLVLAFFMKNAFSQECKIDTLASSYKFILEVPETVDSLGYDRLFKLCDSLGIEVICPEDQPARPIDYFRYYKISLENLWNCINFKFSPICQIRVKD